MDYRQAINLAKEGKEEGYQFLYESTYKSKYYLALKYLRDEQAAQDVLQDAYIKAFAKLDTLEKPESFSSWLGVIVGNLAKNQLQKKNPLLFSDAAVNEEDESFEYEIEDENPDYQPELSYSKQETQQLLHEMINALSEEQRVCILMYEIEGIPIREIAAALDCSENTVKSRLNYGRKNLRKKAEELQKKGYKLYGWSALPLLLLLLRKEESALSADGLLEAAQSQAAKQILSHAGTEQASGIKAAATSQKVPESGKNFAVRIAKEGFLHTVAGKATAALVGFAIAGGIAGTAYFIGIQSDKTASKTETSSTISASQSEVLQNSHQDMTSEEASSQETSSSGAMDENKFDETYAFVLDSIKHKKPGYEFANDLDYTGKIKYFYHDLNQDGIKELVVGAECTQGPFMAMDCKFYSYKKENGDYRLIEVSKSQVVLELCLPQDGFGLFSLYLSRMSGIYDCERLSMENYEIKVTDLPEYHFQLGDSEEKLFRKENPRVKWIDLDYSK